MKVILAFLLCAYITIAAATESNSTLESKVRSTKLVSVGELTYVVSIRALRSHRCGGSLITWTHVLSLARCVFQMVKKTVKGKLTRLGYSVYVGSVHRKMGGMSIKIVDADIHPQFDPSRVDTPGNIAVLLIQDALKHTHFSVKENIKLIPVASHGNRFEGDAVLAGWSRQVVSNLERTDEDFRLKKMEVSIKSNEHCPFGNGSISEDYICGKRMDPDESPEDGDGGSPLVYKSQIIGLYSYIFPYKNRWSVDVYTNVFKHKKYISEAMERLKERNKGGPKVKKNTSKFNIIKKPAIFMRNKLTKKKEEMPLQTA